MLFKRRKNPSHMERLRVAVWPRHSWLRSVKYFSKRVLRLSASPHTIALGFAAGAFTSFTPLIGFHFLIAAAIAFIIGGNILASALGTSVGNPLTFPFIWASTYKLGTFVLHGEPAHMSHHPLVMSKGFLEHSLDALWPLIKPMLVGCIPLGIVAGVTCYVVVRFSVAAYQKTRRHRLQLRQKAAAFAKLHREKAASAVKTEQD
ncbi:MULTISPECIES: DUF2062 domain-containing protein [Pseudovibrio]|uniref:DUF2062 domain-containing protein n=1 Tax=Stappiaceae TaxID=2821832 RepID=UPI002366BA97|nr:MULTISPECIES: DUF2062 domain-containing protein [Pseudovibrio]MDD7908367.1 DUF2062 domain-containing protein [Pseudovibrio exalbescens]MDX5592493.1 DUF2062 domain-containing protein [Pseudovibrio sp. SPO723]